MPNEELVKRYNSGEVEALDELTKMNMGLIHKIAQTYFINSNAIEYDDIIQQGWIGLHRAVQTYRADKPNSAKFSTWAVYWIRASINRFLERHKFDEVSLNTHIGDGEIEAIDMLEDQDDQYAEMWRKLENKELRITLDGLMDKYLPMREKEVIKIYYGWDGTKSMTFEDIGQLYEITKQRVHGIHDKAISRLRKTGWAMQRFQEKIAAKRIALRYNDPVFSVIWSNKK